MSVRLSTLSARIARTPSVLAGALLLATGALAALAPPAQADPLPPTAVAMGDSFISGEGAGAYTAVTDQNGVPQGFPGWSAPNSNPYFCHRSANASIQVASLPGITQRVNLACSGAQPADMAHASSARPAGRTVAAQIAQLRTVAQTGDIERAVGALGLEKIGFEGSDSLDSPDTVFQ